LLSHLKAQAASLKKETYALVIAAGDRRVPWYAKAFLALVLAYAFSPIDLIPDFIPVLGYLDDLVLIPLGITLALKMIPAEVMAEARQQAGQRIAQGKPVSRAGVVLIVAIWLLLLAAVLWPILKSLV
jgi:uncharacterized membrane protein YkvA (DUF1232 family)